MPRNRRTERDPGPRNSAWKVEDFLEQQLPELQKKVPGVILGDKLRVELPPRAETGLEDDEAWAQVRSAVRQALAGALGIPMTAIIVVAKKPPTK